MKKSENRALDNFFRSKLKKAEKKDRGWNNPPDDIFDQAMDQLYGEEKEDRRLVPIYILLGLLGLIVLGSSYIYNSKLNGISKRVNHIEENIQTNQVSKNQNDLSNVAVGSSIPTSHPPVSGIQNTQTNPTEKIQADPIPTKSAANPVSNHATNSHITSVTNNFLRDKEIVSKVKFKVTNPISESIYKGTDDIDMVKSSDLVSSKTSSEGLMQMRQTKPANEHSAKMNVAQTSSHSSDDIHIGSTALAFSILPSIAILPFDLSEEKIRPDFQLATAENQQISIPSFQIELFSGVNFSTLGMKNITMASDASLTEYDKIYAGHSYGVSGQWNVSRDFSIAAGVTRHEFHNTSLLRESTSYMPSQHSANEYAMSMDITSPVGSVVSTALFDVGTSPIDISDELATNTNIDQTLKTTSFSLGAKYYLSISNSTRLYTGLGYNYEMIGSINNDFNAALVVNSNVVSQYNMKPREMTKDVNNFSSIHAQIGIEQSLNPRLSIGLRTQFNRSISTLRNQTTSDDPSTNIKYLNSNLGIIYKL